jgi:hypothetical protein
MPMKGDDYFAELYVAGILARAGWNVYFPHRDEGFDFIISKSVGGKMLIRPVQVKGKYPEPNKTDKPVYGYIGQLTQKHPEMVLAIPYFSVDRAGIPPEFVAYMPLGQIRPHKRGCRCLPAEFKGGCPKPRKYYSKFMNENGVGILESDDWKDLAVVDPIEDQAQYADL